MLAVLFLMGLGMIQVYSSSFIFSAEQFGAGLYFFKKQFFFFLLGLFSLITVLFFPSKYLKLGILMCFVSFIGILLTFSPLGITAGGSTRWLSLPFGQRIEPSEFFKLGIPFVTAFLLNSKKLTQKTHLLKFLWLIFFLSLLPLLKQPDFGSFVICSCLIIGVLFATGLPWKYLLSLGAFSSVLFYFLIVKVPYRYHRVISFIDPWKDPSKGGFQAIQSQMTFHSGGFFGTGLGEGQGKLFFLPEAHTDFTLAVLGEETGYFGFLIVLFLYAFIVFKAFRITAQTKDQFLQYLSLGLSILFSLSVVLNMGVVLGLSPAKGLTLPFLSYGGSSFLANSLLLGFLMNIDRFNHLKTKDKYLKFQF